MCQPSEQSTGKDSGIKRQREKGWLGEAPPCVHLGAIPLCVVKTGQLVQAAPGALAFTDRHNYISQPRTEDLVL